MKFDHLNDDSNNNPQFSQQSKEFTDDEKESQSDFMD
jgi:hypothetical protein